MTTYSNSTNSSVWVSLSVSEKLTHRNSIRTSKGIRVLEWQQEHRFTNAQNITARGRNETLFMQQYLYTQSSPAATNATDDPDYEEDADDSDCPDPDLSTAVSTISFFQASAPSPNETIVNSTLYAVIDHGTTDEGDNALAKLVYPLDPSDDRTLAESRHESRTRQNGSCFYIWNNTYYENAGPIDPAEGTTGATEQWLGDEREVPTLSGMSQTRYGRHVRAEDGYKPRLEEDELDGNLSELDSIPEVRVVSGEGINLLPIDDQWEFLVYR